MNDFIRYVLYSIIGAIIFLLIYSIWFNPSIITNVKDSLSSSIKIKTLSEESFPCKESLQEYIKIQRIRRGSSLKINLQEAKEFNSKEELANYFKKWGGGESKMDVVESIKMLDCDGGNPYYSYFKPCTSLTFPLNVALIHYEGCDAYSCDSWFVWGICNNTEFEYKYNIGYV